MVWHGLSTAHVRASFGDHLTLDELRDLLGADQSAAIHASCRRDGPASDSPSARYDLISSISHAKRSPKRTAKRLHSTSSGFLRALHHRRTSLESDRRLEDRDVLQKAIQRIGPVTSRAERSAHIHRHTLQLVERLLHWRPDHGKLIQHRFRLIVRTLSFER